MLRKKSAAFPRLPLGEILANRPGLVSLGGVELYEAVALVSPREVTDLYLSRGINIEHAQTAYLKTCGIEYQQPYHRCNSQTPYYNGT